MYAIIQTGGKQYKVSVGDTLLVEKLSGVKGDSVNFDKVLLFTDGTDTKVGTPHLEGMSVNGTILDQEKGVKVRVSKFKAKVRYRKTIGHRQLYTRVNITKIQASPSTEKKSKTRAKPNK